MSDERLQRESRARIRAETNGDPSWVDLGNGYFALHIQYGGNAVTARFDGSGDADAFREWLAFHWPPERPWATFAASHDETYGASEAGPEREPAP